MVTILLVHYIVVAIQENWSYERLLYVKSIEILKGTTEMFNLRIFCLIVMLACLSVSFSSVGLAKYMEERSIEHQAIFARSMHDQVLVKNQAWNRWMLLDLNTENDVGRGFCKIELNTTVYSKDRPKVLALGIFFNHSDEQGRVYIPDEDGAVFFHNRVFSYRSNFLEEQIELHAEELRERIVQAESITVKIKMESIDHKIAIHSFDLPPEILAEWKQVADISLNAEQGSM